VYFDITRSRALGRKVSKSLAVENPLAREIADACGSLGLKAVFEPGKTHPKDWSNPGRVRVLLKQDGEPCHPLFTNSKSPLPGDRRRRRRRLMSTEFLLHKAVGEYLKAHPTTPETPLKLRIPNVPYDGKPPRPPVVPRGWKMGTILPLHSPALSGPGVTEDIFKEMMEGMGMGGMAGAPGASGGAVEGKKEKKEKKKKR
jgi:signal recognition particle subunit SRP19